ncbi:MAG: peptidoglycan-binding domain-containing protein [Planctomycetota bacterium]|jgi:hypothetical protein
MSRNESNTIEAALAAQKQQMEDAGRQKNRTSRNREDDELARQEAQGERLAAARQQGSRDTLGSEQAELSREIDRGERPWAAESAGRNERRDTEQGELARESARTGNVGTTATSPRESQSEAEQEQGRSSLDQALEQQKARMQQSSDEEQDGESTEMDDLAQTQDTRIRQAWDDLESAQELHESEADLAQNSMPAQADLPTPESYTRYEARDGDCALSIAHQFGFHWKSIWNDPANAELRQMRDDKQATLLAGDIVFIRPRKLKTERGSTETRHRFRRLGEPAKLRLCVLSGDEPRANEPYRLVLDREVRTGQLDDEGALEEAIAIDETSAELYVGHGVDEEYYDLGVGSLPPIDTIQGIQARLNNLGFDCGKVCPRMNEETRLALMNFQSKWEQEVTGVADRATRDLLEQQHES